MGQEGGTGLQVDHGPSNRERTLYLVPCWLPGPESARKTLTGMNELLETGPQGGKPAASESKWYPTMWVILHDILWTLTIEHLSVSVMSCALHIWGPKF